MTNFYATYPASTPSSVSVTTVQGEGTPGSQTGGLLTVQGDPSGTPIPISGAITATNPSVSTTGSSVPASATYAGMNVSGNLTGLTGTSNGLKVDGSAVTQPVNVTQFGTNNVVTGTGTSGSGIPRVTVSNDSNILATQSGAWNVSGTGTAGTPATGVLTIQGINSMTPVKVDPSGGTGSVNVAQFGGNNVVTGTGASGSGIPRVTVSNDSNILATQSGTWNIGTVTTVTTVSTVTAVTAISNALPAGTNLLGKVGIDQTTPGTTNAIQSTSGTTATWQAEGSIAFGSITTSFQTVFTPSSSTKMLFMRNNTNGTIVVSMDAGTTTNFVFDPGDQISMDFVTDGLISTTTAIQIKYTGSAPTSGSFRVNGCH